MKLINWLVFGPVVLLAVVLYALMTGLDMMGFLIFVALLWSLVLQVREDQRKRHHDK